MARCGSFLRLLGGVAAVLLIAANATAAFQAALSAHRVTRILFSGVNGDDETSPTTTTTIVQQRPDEDKDGAAANGVTPRSILDPVQGEEVSSSNIFDLVAARSAVCLYQSDIRRDAIGKGAGKQASSATNWIHDESAFALQKSIDRLKLKLPEERTGIDRDEAAAWLRWFKSMPSSTILDFSASFRSAVNATLSDASLQHIDQKREDFLSRLGCRIILLPSGATLSSPLTEPSASIIYGKLLYGGVTRYRLLGSHYRSQFSSSSSPPPQRKAGLRTEVKPTARDNVAAWMMYGGPDRRYDAVDMGAAAVFEVFLLPRGKKLESDSAAAAGVPGPHNMVVDGIPWKPQDMFDYYEDDGAAPPSSSLSDDNNPILGYTPASLASGKDRNDAFRSDFQSAVGGLQPQIDAIVRRVLDGRVIRPADENEGGRTVDETMSHVTSSTALEAEELEMLGLSPVRGLLLYGPPGCGKTALAREIAVALRARTPKIVSAPELLDRWVGGSEKLVRLLFADAEAELAACNGDATKSALHVVVIDEIDGVFRRRSSAEDSGEATRSSVVNQILSKLDGVNSIPNLLLIGMTNRRELLDDALLRPGRLEVQVEIPLPDKAGRREIMQIHFDALRKKGRLSRPLCCAIDGVPASIHKKDDTTETTDILTGRGRKRRAVKKAICRIVPSSLSPVYDLASASATGGFSGADIAGLVRCAGSLALARCRKDGNGVEGLLITLEDVKQALVEVKR